MKSLCPICKKPLASESRQGPHPFCSWRCKKLDLHRWLHEEYRFSEPLGSDTLQEPESQADTSEPGAFS